MRKALLIMAAALMTMTQCRKENATPNMPADGTVKMTVTAGPGRTDINTATGAITWSAGDKLYVSDSTNWLGSLTLVGEGGSSQGLFTGNVAIGGGTTPCHFFYLGRDNGMTEPTAGTGTDAVISLASQDGTLRGENGAMKYHIGYGRTDVTVTEGEATGSVKMDTKIAIAHINFTTGGTTAYTGSVTMGGTGISNTLTVSPDGSFSGSGDGGIAIDKGDGTTGERFVTLIPTGETSIFVAFTGDATGSMAFANGIVENKFYGMKDAIAVTLEAAAPKFSVSATTTVEFSPGNLWYGKAEGEETAAFHFEADQWGTQPTSDGEWVSSHVSHFYWSMNAAEATKDYFNYEQSMSTDDVFFTEASGFQVNGYEANTWRTLTNDEWNYLLNSRTGASSLRAWVTLSNVSVSGLVLLPDGSTATASGITTSSALADAGAVFLPAAGSRDGTDVYRVGSYGYYWSSTPDGDYEGLAYGMYFNSGSASTDNDSRYLGNAVRLVR